MELVVNGERIEVEPESTVASLIEHVQLGGAACAVEVNRVLVPRREHKTHRLQGGDSIEIVTLVGGG